MLTRTRIQVATLSLVLATLLAPGCLRAQYMGSISGRVVDAITRERIPDVEDKRLVFRNAVADVLYVVDGQVIRPPMTFYIDAAGVDCVEVRRGYSAVAEFKPSVVGENYSGVELIWTNGAIGPRPQQCLPGG